jgi:hypothetical protein
MLRPPSRIARSVPALACALALAACHPARLAVPSDVAAATEVVDVRNRSGATGMLANEDFEIGDLRVRGVDRSATSSMRWSAGSVSKSESDGGYTFRLEGGEAPLEGECRYANERASMRSALLMGNVSAASESLDCACGQDVRVRLRTNAGGATPFPSADDSRLTGHLLLDAGRTFTVRSLHGFEGGATVHVAAGYRVDRDGSPFAAVEVLAPGRVFLPRELAPADRARLTCLLTGMILYVPPSDRR